uniref:Uncharacterized protein n=1 Tax=Romanomermis culicivorax TaxID=13658 RepID=A0A915HFS7_ROMCU
MLPIFLLLISIPFTIGESQTDVVARNLLNDFVGRLIKDAESFLRNLTRINNQTSTILTKLSGLPELIKKIENVEKNKQDLTKNLTSLSQDVQNLKSNNEQLRNLTRDNLTQIFQNLKQFGRILSNPDDSRLALKALSQNYKIKDGFKIAENQMGIQPTFFDLLFASFLPSEKLLDQASATTVGIGKSRKVVDVLLNPCGRMNCTKFLNGLRDLQVMTNATRYRNISRLMQDTQLLTNASSENGTIMTGYSFFDTLFDKIYNLTRGNIFENFATPCPVGKASCKSTTVATVLSATPPTPHFTVAAPAVNQTTQLQILSKILDVPKFKSLSDLLNYIFKSTLDLKNGAAVQNTDQQGKFNSSEILATSNLLSSILN